MKTITLKFKSLLVENVDEIIPGSSRTKFRLEFKINTVEDHTLELSLMDILRDKAWIINFFLSFMIASPVSALLYGILTAGFNIDFSTGPVKNIFAACAILCFLIIWIAFSIPGAVKNKKNDHVKQKRGKGNWKIIDEEKWHDFSRLLALSQKKEE